jgi:hypothetical protein
MVETKLQTYLYEAKNAPYGKGVEAMA